jgi:FKBP-type peptidyl-prolyl cis-trans isomerase FkpA
MRATVGLVALLGGLITSWSCGGGTVASLEIIDTKVGTGTEAAPGWQLTVHYTGWLHDPEAEGQRGTRFDSSRDGGGPFTFRLGHGEVIRGWDEGLDGMRVGGVRTLVVPAYLAYGETGAGGGAIPPNAALVFDVELLAVE